MSSPPAGGPSAGSGEQRWEQECAQWAANDRRIVARIRWIVAVAAILGALAWMAVRALRHAA